MQTSNNASRVIVALDYPDTASALSFADSVGPDDCRLKVGLELFTLAGGALVDKLAQRGFDIFLDLKFHDIPNTVAQACRAAAGLGVWMVNVHALGGSRMMTAAREAVDSCSHRPLLIAVTILTSHSPQELEQIGLTGDPGEMVSRLAAQAQQSGLDGVVCSPHEAAGIKHAYGDSFLRVTPGVRPTGSGSDDQRRVMTPAEALAQGSSYLVIGRPITRADNPDEVLAAINRSLANG